MKTTVFKKIATVSTLALVLVALSTSVAFAQDAEDDFVADIEIMETLLLTNMGDLDFGMVSQPEDGEATLTLNPDGSIDNPEGLAVSGTSVGTFELSGDDSQNVFIDTEITGDFAGDLSLDTILVEGGDDQRSIDSADWTTEDLFSIGGEVTIQETVDVDTYQADFTVTASYE